MDTTNTNQTPVTTPVVSTPKTTRGLKIALTRKANQLKAKIVNLVIKDNNVTFEIEANNSANTSISNDNIIIQLKAIAKKLGYTVS